MSDYNEEKPKLLKKAKEPKSEIDRMKKLETELKKIQKEKESQNSIHEEKKNELKKINDSENVKFVRRLSIMRLHSLPIPPTTMALATPSRSIIL